jgi:hypothetical protein
MEFSEVNCGFMCARGRCDGFVKVVEAMEWKIGRKIDGRLIGNVEKR